MQKPTLLGVEGQAEEILEEFNAGLCFKPENKEDFINKLAQLRDDNILYAKKQEGCKKLAIEYDRRKLAIKMLSIIKELIIK